MLARQGGHRKTPPAQGALGVSWCSLTILQRQREWRAFWFVLGWSEQKGSERSFRQTSFTLREKPWAHLSVPDGAGFVSAHTGCTD